MPRLTFPSAADQLVYAVTGNDQPILAKPGLSVRIYMDAACTTVADIRTVAGGAITNSALTVDSNSLIPLFLGPDATPPVDTLYVRPTSLSTGNGFPIYAREDDRLDNKVDKAGGDTIAITDAAVRGLVIRGATGQTAKLQEWQSSDGGVAASIAVNGKATFAALETGDYTNPGGSIGVGGPAFQYGARIESTVTSANHKGLVVRGAASQTANLQEWQNSAGTPLALVDKDGVVRSAAVNAFLPQPFFIGLIIRAAVAQTASLAEWQDAAGTVLTRVNSSGNMQVGMANGGTPNVGLQVGAVDSNTRFRVNTDNFGGSTAWIRGDSDPSDAVLRVDARFPGHSGRMITATNSVGGELFFVDSAGGVYSNHNITAANDIITGVGALYAQGVTGANNTFYGAAANIAPRNPNERGLIVRGRSGQSTNLQEWQNSGGGLSMAVNAAGRLVFSGLDNQAALGSFAGSVNVVIGGTTYRMPLYNT